MEFWDIWPIVFTGVMLLSSVIFILRKVFQRRRLTDELDVDLDPSEITSPRRTRTVRRQIRRDQAQKRKELIAKYGDPNDDVDTSARR